MSRLREHAREAYAAAEALLTHPALQPARAVLAEQRSRLDATMRVALVGRVSAGKSTLANALLGGRHAPTGLEELTFNVNWLRHGPERTLTIHFHDQRPPERRDITELEQLTVRARENGQLRNHLRRIAYLEVTDPNPQLRDFDLIDTPGLDSHFGQDSANTLAFLGRTGAQVRADTADHAARADALVLVFARGLAIGEEELVSDFTGAGLEAGAVTTIGALTKVEQFWPQAADPMAEGRVVADRLLHAAGAGRLLYDLRPVASLVGSAAATFSAAHHADLVELALGMDPPALAKRVRRGPHFAALDHPDYPIPAPSRAALLQLFGGYGIVTACTLIREGLTDPEHLRRELLDRSGILDFRRLLTDHFGNRATVIKTSKLIRDATRHAAMVTLPPDLRSILDQAVTRITNLLHTEHNFAELDALRQHYDGTLTLDPEESDDLLHITGEHGTAPHERLALPPGATYEQLVLQARLRQRHWAVLAADPMTGGAARRAIHTVRRSYDLLLNELTSPEMN